MSINYRWQGVKGLRINPGAFWGYILLWVRIVMNWRSWGSCSDRIKTLSQFVCQPSVNQNFTTFSQRHAHRPRLLRHHVCCYDRSCLPGVYADQNFFGGVLLYRLILLSDSSPTVIMKISPGHFSPLPHRFNDENTLIKAWYARASFLLRWQNIPYQNLVTDPLGLSLCSSSVRLLPSPPPAVLPSLAAWSVIWSAETFTWSRKCRSKIF